MQYRGTSYINKPFTIIVSNEMYINTEVCEQTPTIIACHSQRPYVVNIARQLPPSTLEISCRIFQICVYVRTLWRCINLATRSRWPIDFFFFFSLQHAMLHAERIHFIEHREPNAGELCKPFGLAIGLVLQGHLRRLSWQIFRYRDRSLFAVQAYLDSRTDAITLIGWIEW